MIVIKTSSKWALSFLSNGHSLEKYLIIGEANCDDLAENKSSVQLTLARGG